jgi:hypothetical protein
MGRLKYAVQQLKSKNQLILDNTDRALGLSEQPNPEVERVIKEVGGGVESEAVFETWVYIVAKLPGKQTLPTITDIDKILKEKEVVDKGVKWTNDFRTKYKNKLDLVLCKTIELIGKDIKEIKDIPWGTGLQIIHKSIGDYYKNTPEKYIAKGSKENTADMIFLTKGTATDLLNNLPNSTLTWSKDGKISIQGKDIEFVQVSLKKGSDSARIGKLNTLFNYEFGQLPQSPSKLVGDSEFNLNKLLQQEGFFGDLVKKTKDLFTKGISSVITWAKGTLTGLRNFFLKSIIKAFKTIERDKVHTSATNILKLTGFNTLTEAAGDPVPINAALVREMGVLQKEIIVNDLVNKEYKSFVENVGKINKLKKNSILINNAGTIPTLDTKLFKTSANIVLKRGIGKTISREELLPALKLVVNYASYRTFNILLSDMQSKMKDINDVGEVLVSLSGKLKAEAMFGSTELPLYIVYGSGGGAHFKNTRDEFGTITKDEVQKLGESMDVPYMVFRVAKSGGKKNYNSIYLLLLTGSKISGKEVQPEFLKIQFINRSGSGFSYKIDAMSTQIGYH